MAHPSILNDVIGPIMRGPSSSHTAGAHRIARIACDLLGERARKIRVTFDPAGSYAPTCTALGVDIAFAAAIMGWEMTDERYRDAPVAVAEAGIELRFDEEPLPFDDHPNAVRIRMESAGGTTMEAWARSVGGGIIEFARVDDRPVRFDGRAWATVVGCPQDDRREIERLLGTGPATRSASGDDGDEAGGAALVIETAGRPADGTIRAIRNRPGVAFVRVAAPVLLAQPGSALFTSADELLSYVQSVPGGVTLAECALSYESALLGISPAECREEMGRRVRVMLDSVSCGLDDRTVKMPLVDPTASTIMKSEREGRIPLGGILTRAGARAIAAMHTCNSKGVVCAAPTGGSAGVVAGVLATMAEEMGVSDERVVDAAFVAGVVGMIMARRATFAAEEAGCQVEIGFAGAMAAAAVIEVFGGTPAQALSGAAVSLQNTSGMVCDTVGGGCELPCQTRNAAAASGAFLIADLVMGGYVNPIPLDESIDASYQAGIAIPADLRCTSRGGLAVTPSALRLVAARVGQTR